MIAYFLRQWIKSCMRKLGGDRPRLRKTCREARRFQVEQLEDRVTPASISWTGGAGTLNWGDAGNWSTATVPTSSDDVTISKAG
jgi:hypothetical protein